MRVLEHLDTGLDTADDDDENEKFFIMKIMTLVLRYEQGRLVNYTSKP